MEKLDRKHFNKVYEHIAADAVKGKEIPKDASIILLAIALLEIRDELQELNQFLKGQKK